MKKALLALMACLVLSLAACASGNSAADAARARGLTDVTVDARHDVANDFYGCFGDEATAFEVSGTAPDGRRVHIVVCCEFGMIFGDRCYCPTYH